MIRFVCLSYLKCSLANQVWCPAARGMASGAGGRWSASRRQATSGAAATSSRPSLSLTSSPSARASSRSRPTRHVLSVAPLASRRSALGDDRTAMVLVLILTLRRSPSAGPGGRQGGSRSGHRGPPEDAGAGGGGGEDHFVLSLSGGRTERLGARFPPRGAEAFPSNADQECRYGLIL